MKQLSFYAMKSYPPGYQVKNGNINKVYLYFPKDSQPYFEPVYIYSLGPVLTQTNLIDIMLKMEEGYK